MITRRTVLEAGIGLAATLGTPAAALARPASANGFVRRTGTGFTIDGRPYRFAGANLWYAAYLGADAAYGDRARLARELDALAGMGVTNLRILAGSERSPLKGSVSPSFRDAGRAYNPELLAGLDHVLAEIGRRGMKAVLYLTNFWEWSGGMMTYLSYVNGGRYIDANDPAHPWPAFANQTARFYAEPRAVALYTDWVRAIVGRTNSVTGQPYARDPAIMAWQLANEPRAGGDAATAEAMRPAFLQWVRGTARLIKALAPDQLVSTGSEGVMGSAGQLALARATHAIPEIDYLTAHIWPLNWSWIDARDLGATHAAGKAKVAAYLRTHEALARDLGKPLVIEEFGYPRDGGSYAPNASTGFRDRFYGQIYDAVLNSARTGGPIAGSNFWAWNGSGRGRHADFRFHPGDTAWLGDPPHEPQGWYGVFDTDARTRARITAHARELAAAAGPIAA